MAFCLVISDLPNVRLDLFSEAEVTVDADTPDDDLVHLEDYWLRIDHNQDSAARVRLFTVARARRADVGPLYRLPYRRRQCVSGRCVRHEFLWPSRAKAHPRIRVIINLVSNTNVVNLWTETRV